MTSDEFRAVDPIDPEQNRKKTLRSPYQTMQIAADVYPKAVVHSEGHVTQNAARSGVKRIQAGENGWDLFPNRNAFVRKNPDGKTWDVCVGFHFKDRDAERADAERAADEVGRVDAGLWRIPKPTDRTFRQHRRPGDA